MYLSLKLFHPELPLYAGDLGLTSTQRRALAVLGVSVLDTPRAEVIRARELPLTYGHFLLHAYLSEAGVAWDSVLWIDADTLVLRPIDEIFEHDVDVAGHPGRNVHGPIFTLGDAL